jgi:GTP-binding protein
VYRFTETAPFTLTRLGEHRFILEGDELNRIFQMAELKTDEGALRFARRLKLMGVDEALKSAGAQEDDIIMINDYQFLYRE